MSDLSYADAGNELDAIIEELETGVVDVDRLVERLERATDIVDELDRRLRRTRLQVEELVPRLEAIGRREVGTAAGRGKPAEPGITPAGTGLTRPEPGLEVDDDAAEEEAVAGAAADEVPLEASFESSDEAPPGLF